MLPCFAFASGPRKAFSSCYMHHINRWLPPLYSTLLRSRRSIFVASVVVSTSQGFSSSLCCIIHSSLNNAGADSIPFMTAIHKFAIHDCVRCIVGARRYNGDRFSCLWQTLSRVLSVNNSRYPRSPPKAFQDKGGQIHGVYGR